MSSRKAATAAKGSAKEGNAKTRWRDSYEKLKEFYEKNNHCNVTKGENPNLYKWVARQRGERSEFLNAERRKLLDDLNFQWNTPKTTTSEVNWELNFAKLKEYLQQGNPGKIANLAEYDQVVATWATNQRKRNQKGMLRADRKKKLESIKFDFGRTSKSRPQALGQTQVQRWEDMFQRLVEFKEKHGHACVPYMHEDKSLALWVTTQRREFSGKSWYGADRQIREERKNRLDAIGFVWNYLKEKKGKAVELSARPMKRFAAAQPNSPPPVEVEETPLVVHEV